MTINLFNLLAIHAEKKKKSTQAGISVPFLLGIEQLKQEQRT